MSVEQIIREFPFMRIHRSDAAHVEHWPGATTDMRVARLSIDALFIELLQIAEKEFHIYSRIETVDEKGKCVFAQNINTTVGDDSGTIGDILLRIFIREDKEWADMTRYIVYTMYREVGRWERRLGSRPRRNFRVAHTEAVLYKMPKSMSLWDLLQKYRQKKKALANS